MQTIDEVKGDPAVPEAVSKRLRRSRLRKILLAVVCAIALTAGAAVLPSPEPAEAAGPSYINNYWGANMRWCSGGPYGYPSLSCPRHSVTPWLSNGTKVTMLCWKDGGWANGRYWSNRWFFVDTDIVTGWVHSSLVANQTWVRRC